MAGFFQTCQYYLRLYQRPWISEPFLVVRSKILRNRKHVSRIKTRWTILMDQGEAIKICLENLRTDKGTYLKPMQYLTNIKLTFGLPNTVWTLGKRFDYGRVCDGRQALIRWYCSVEKKKKPASMNIEWNILLALYEYAHSWHWCAEGLRRISISNKESPR